MIITVSREFGAGGAEIARRAAEALDWSFVDNEFIDEVARRAGLRPEEVAAREERAPGFMERLARTLAKAMPEFVAPEGGTVPELAEEELVRVTEMVVADLASAGPAVLVGRAAPAVLSRRGDALHVKIVAPVADRALRIAERLAVPREEAERLVHQTDENRARYHRQYYHRDWHDPVNYHLVLNSSWLGVERAVKVIVGAVSTAPSPPASPTAPRSA